MVRRRVGAGQFLITVQEPSSEVCVAVIGELRTSDMLGKDLELVRDLHTLSADVVRVPGGSRIAARASWVVRDVRVRVGRVTVGAFAGSLGLGSVIGSFAWADHG
jgi:hypothetical protein